MMCRLKSPAVTTQILNSVVIPTADYTDSNRASYYTFFSTVKPTRCTNVSNLFYFEMTLYMFRTVFPPIISSSRLYIQQQAFVKQILLSAC